MPIHCLVTSRCMQFIFGEKGEAICLIRECPVTEREGTGEGNILISLFPGKCKFSLFIHHAGLKINHSTTQI